MLPPSYPHGAGVVVHDGAGHVLLGLQRDGWSSFAGKGEAGETPEQTAVRECGEETLFVLQDRLPALGPPIMTSVTPRGVAFHLFEAKVPHDSMLPTRFDAVRRSQRFLHVKGCRETRHVRWFRVDRLHEVRLRPSFRTDLGCIVAALTAARTAQSGRSAHCAGCACTRSAPARSIRT